MSMFEIINDMLDSRLEGNNFIRASVVNPPPELKIKFDNIEIPSEQIYCSNFLLPNYQREYKIDGTIGEIAIDTTTQNKVGDPHGTIKGTGRYETNGNITFEDALKVGDEVLVLVLGVHYVVVSKIVKMPSSAIDGV